MAGVFTSAASQGRTDVTSFQPTDFRHRTERMEGRRSGNAEDYRKLHTLPKKGWKWGINTGTGMAKTFKNFDKDRHRFQSRKRGKIRCFAIFVLHYLYPFKPKSVPKWGRKHEKTAFSMQKHRTSRGKSTALSYRKYGCFPLRSPMFLIFRPQMAHFPAENPVKVLLVLFCDISEQARSWWLPMPFSRH